MTAENYNLKIEKYKVLFQYVFICLISLLFGIFFANIIGMGSLLNFEEQIRAHFFSTISEDEPFANMIISVINYSLNDIICIISAFLFTFSIFNYLASDIILVYEGLNIGFSCTVLYKCCSIFNMISDLYFVYYTLFKLVLLIFIIAFLYGLSVYSFKLKSYTSTLRVRLNLKLLLFLLLFTISGCGFVFLLNSIYYVVIVIF